MRNRHDISSRLSITGYRFVDSGKDGFAANNKTTRIVFSWGGGWEHVSVSLFEQRTPTWTEMCEVKDMLWNKDETCVQYHPAEKDYINNHEYCLHIWKPTGRIHLPTPPKIMVGV